MEKQGSELKEKIVPPDESRIARFNEVDREIMMEICEIFLKHGLDARPLRVEVIVRNPREPGEELVSREEPVCWEVWKVRYEDHEKVDVLTLECAGGFISWEHPKSPGPPRKSLIPPVK